MQNLINLSNEQERAVAHVNGALLVKASAGSGKTRVLTERIKRLLDISKKKILAITFTNKAGDEMRERLDDSSLIKSRVFVGTFHGFCKEILEQRCNLIGLSQMPQIFEKESDRLQLIEDAIQITPSYLFKYNKLDDSRKLIFRKNLLESIATIKRELITDGDILTQYNEDTFLLYKSYQDILISQNAIDFDDLIKLTYDLFISNPAVASLYRKTYGFICIDEAQDLNKAQYQLLKAITNGEFDNVMMVGDPNQSIFAFNGSSSSYMNKKFIEDFHPDVIKLDENFRSSKKVIEAAEKIIPDSTVKAKIAITGIFEIIPADDELSESKWIINKINELIAKQTHKDIEGPISLEKMAVLARNKFVFLKLEEQLKDNNLPYYYKISPGALIFESETMNIFDLALAVKLNPSDNLHLIRLRKLLNLSSDNVVFDQIVNYTINESHKSIIELVYNLKDDGSNLKLLFNNLKDIIKSNSTIHDDDEKNLIINEIDEVITHWIQYAKKTDNKSLKQFKNAMALGQTHPLSSPNGITLSTVHTMKGQEYDIVFLMGMDDGTFPDYRAIKNEGVEMIQEKNNLYVAFTRAKRFLYVTYPKQRKMPWGDIKDRNKSRFLYNF